MKISSLTRLLGYKIVAIDGEIGKIDDFCIDDRFWKIKYAVDKTGFWLFERQLLLPPTAIREIDEAGQQIFFDLTRDQIRDSKHISHNKTVTSTHSRDADAYFAVFTKYTGYKSDDSVLNAGKVVPTPPTDFISDEEIASDVTEYSLKNAGEMLCMTAFHSGGELGRVADILCDEEWRVAYLLIDTNEYGNFGMPLFAPEWALSIKWAEKTLVFDIPLKKILDAPRPDHMIEITEDFMETLHKHYGFALYQEKG